MRPLVVAVAVGEGVSPTSDVALAAADEAAAQFASAWTPPEYIDNGANYDAALGFDVPDNVTVYHYHCMAEPKN